MLTAASFSGNSAADVFAAVTINPGWHFARRKTELNLTAIPWHFSNHSISSFITTESHSPPGCWHCRCFLLPAVLDILSAAEWK